MKTQLTKVASRKRRIVEEVSLAMRGAEKRGTRHTYYFDSYSHISGHVVDPVLHCDIVQ